MACVSISNSKLDFKTQNFHRSQWVLIINFLYFKNSELIGESSERRVTVVTKYKYDLPVLVQDC